MGKVKDTGGKNRQYERCEKKQPIKETGWRDDRRRLGSVGYCESRCAVGGEQIWGAVGKLKSGGGGGG